MLKLELWLDLIRDILFFVKEWYLCLRVRNVCGLLFLVGFRVRIFLLSRLGGFGFVFRVRCIYLVRVFTYVILIMLPVF